MLYCRSACLARWRTWALRSHPLCTASGQASKTLCEIEHAYEGMLLYLHERGLTVTSQCWPAGDMDDGMVKSCTEAKDQAAVLSILFHTRKIREEYGEPLEQQD